MAVLLTVASACVAACSSPEPGWEGLPDPDYKVVVDAAIAEENCSDLSTYADAFAALVLSEDGEYESDSAMFAFEYTVNAEKSLGCIDQWGNQLK